MWFFQKNYRIILFQFKFFFYAHLSGSGPLGAGGGAPEGSGRRAESGAHRYITGGSMMEAYSYIRCPTFGSGDFLYTNIATML